MGQGRDKQAPHPDAPIHTYVFKKIFLHMQSTFPLFFLKDEEIKR